ncbi:hypothetical protein ACS0TY_009456 [Phlomoides rotata]
MAPNADKKPTVEKAPATEKSLAEKKPKAGKKLLKEVGTDKKNKRAKSIKTYKIYIFKVLNRFILVSGSRAMLWES